MTATTAMRSRARYITAQSEPQAPRPPRKPLSDDGARTLPARNYQRGADRGAKLGKDRGFRNSSYGPAGPARQIDPNTIPDLAIPSPDAMAAKYARYAAEMRMMRRKPLPPLQWIREANAKQ